MAKNLKKFKPDMLYAMRPLGFYDGLSLDEYEVVLGKTMGIDLKKYGPIKLEFLG